MQMGTNINQKSSDNYSTLQFSSLVILRLLIGWHFLYEGFAKLFNPNWSAASFLLDSKGIFSGIFVAMAQNPTILGFVNISNKLGLIAIGLGLMLGAFSRLACASGILLLLMYYFATPPFIGYSYSVPSEGSYMLVNKNLIEAWALFVLILFPTSNVIGIDRLLFPKKNRS